MITEARTFEAPETAEEAERKTSYLELFFDLVFVFAITQVTLLVLEDTSAAGFARSALVLFLVWWAWGGYTWMTNAIDVESPVVRISFLGAMGLSFMVALAVPDAYQDEGAWFGVAYFLVRFVHIALYEYGLRDDPEHRRAVTRLAPWFLVAPVFVLVGGFLDGDQRTALWAIAIAIDVVGALSVGRAGFRVSASHFAERYALFIIIALGESIVAIGVGGAETERNAVFAGAVAICFAGAATLWWAYFDFLAAAYERALRLTLSARRGPLARDVFSFFHFPIVAGIILCAVAGKKTLEHPADPLSGPGRFSLAAGIALAMLGFVLCRYRVRRTIAFERIGIAAAVALAVIVLAEVAATALVAVAVAIFAAGLAVEAIRLREARMRLRTGAV